MEYENAQLAQRKRNLQLQSNSSQCVRTQSPENKEELLAAELEEENKFLASALMNLRRVHHPKAAEAAKPAGQLREAVSRGLRTLTHLPASHQASLRDGVITTIIINNKLVTSS